jgi:quinol-cytochrome oxidoreductase complex cytochrome b subunit
MMLVPGIIGALIGAHLYLVAKLGTTAPPWQKLPASSTDPEERA